METYAERTVTGRDGREFRIFPLTVRQRATLQNMLEERARKAAAADAKAVGMGNADAAAFVREAREKASGIAALISWCFTTDGAIETLAVSLGREDAIALLDATDPKEASFHALAALGIDMSRYEDSAGNA